MSVDQSKISAMGDIMARLNAATSEAPRVLTENGRSSHSDPQIAAMGDIMARFRAATDHVRDDAPNNEELFEALQTERTENGVRIAEWEIQIKQGKGRPGKFYDIYHSTADTTIATDLRLYEAALLLTQELNKGASITSDKIKEILRLEEDYSKNLEDALRYARVAKTAQGHKAMIAEARYSDARSRALSAKEKIKEVR